jgi:hypothetical protein
MKNQGLSKKKLTEFRQEALQWETNAPEALTVDHRKAVNPYMSRYGEGWKQHVKNSCMLIGYIDVRDMVRHIYKKSEELMKGTWAIPLETLRSPCRWIAVSATILTTSSGDTSSTPAFWKKTTLASGE